MQQRHLNREQYFNELAQTAREHYIGYISRFQPITPTTKVLEVGCGEGGNLLPFAEMGCRVTGIERFPERVEQAQAYFQKKGYSGRFIADDFLKYKPQTDEKYDLVLIHDVIKHIPDKDSFLEHLKGFVHKDSLIFWGFPAWQMPFGGHQQICRSRLYSHLPFIHLLPVPVYLYLLKANKETTGCINELLDIRKSRITTERFEQLTETHGLSIVDRCLWLVNPHYEQKFHLKPRKLPAALSRIRYIRNFLSTSCFYLTRYHQST